MRRFVFALVFAFVCAFGANQAVAKDMTKKDFISDALEQITVVSVVDAKAMFDKGGYVILDIREPSEYQAGHVAGAINLPRGLLEFKIDKHISDKDANIIVYCKSGGRGCLGTLTMAQMGYKNTVNMVGGWQAWKEAGYPVE